MKNEYGKVEAMLFFSASFSVLLLSVRIIYYMQFSYLFYPWNFFLAAVPLLISRRLLVEDNLKLRSAVMIFCWFIFFPNASYIITDILHFMERPPVPKWFDLLLVTSAAWNGLILGIVSLLQVEDFLSRHFRLIQVRVFVAASLIASAFGIYLGRFLRFNSWNIITKPGDLAYALSDRFLNPFDHPRTWGFTVLFGIFLSIIYFTVRQLPKREIRSEAS